VTEFLAGATRVYRIKWWRRIFSVFLGVFGLLFLAAQLIMEFDFGDGKHFFSILIGVVILAVGSYAAAKDFKALITLTPDAIQVRNLSGTQQLLLSAIRGRREYVTYSGRSRTRYLRLEPKNNRQPTLDFERDFNFDQAFFAWFNALPDLDAIDEAARKTSKFGLV
jgi:hypothetical protein